MGPVPRSLLAILTLALAAGLLVVEQPWSGPAGAGPPMIAFPGNDIAFSSTRDGNWDIYVMNADGSDLTRLTNATGADLAPAWSPDGRSIAFTSNRDGNAEIYVMNASGLGRRD